MFECLALQRLLEAMVALGGSLHHPLEEEARRALRAYAALDALERQSVIAQALLPALERIASRVVGRAAPRHRPTPPPGAVHEGGPRLTRQDAL